VKAFRPILILLLLYLDSLNIVGDITFATAAAYLLLALRTPAKMDLVAKPYVPLVLLRRIAF
jgi:hypothetical protein